jgi:tetratricopeptide (TPR) repeat protein
VQPGAPSRGLAAREVTAAAALAAGLAFEGPLAQDGPLRLCYLAAAAQAAGRLDLETERGRFALHFKRGVVEHASSDAPEDDLGRYLVARGVVDAAALAAAEKVRAGFAGDLVAALASQGRMNPAESFRVLQDHGAAVVARVLGAEKGTCRFTPGAPLPASSFPLGSRWGVLCEAARRLDGLAVRKLLGERAQRIASRGGGRVELSELKLTAHEARAASLFDGQSTPAGLAASRPAEAGTILRTALLLAETELLAFGELVRPAATATPAAAETTRVSSPAAAESTRVSPPSPWKGEGRGEGRPSADAPLPAPPPASGGREMKTASATAKPLAPAKAAAPAAAPKPSPPKVEPAASPAPKPIVSQDAGALRATYEKVRTADHFEALGVKRDASPGQIKAAYFQLAKSYHPDAGPPNEPPELKKLRADIFGRLGEAWGVLGEDAKRAEYVRQLAEGGVADVDISAIFKAEETFQKATVFVRTRQYDRALEALAEAIKLHAEEPEFGVWKAWVEFLVAQDRPRQHAASAAVIEAALKKVPRCMPGYLFLGQMAKIMGDAVLAERHFKRGLALDDKHAELARELKYLRK